jgi:hypothetical protein
MRRIVVALLFCLCCSSVTFAQRPGRPGPPPDPWAYGPGGPGNWDASWNNRPFPKRGACFFTGKRFSGNRFCVRSGDRLAGLPGGFGNNISSIQSFGGARVHMYGQPRFAGATMTIQRSVVDMDNIKGPGGASWNNRISSLTVN